MPDFDAIADALAGRFAAATMTAPAGYDAVRVATADLPGQMTPLPSALVFLDTGEFETGNGTRLGTHDFLVRFYYNQIGDLERDMTALRKWTAVLCDQLRGAAQLGGIVAVARLDGYRLGVMTYAGVDYSGVELRVRVVTSEGWAAVA